MSPRTKALLAIVGASLLWSTAGLSKIVVRVLDPYTAAFLRFLVASVFILPFFLREKRKTKRMLVDLVPLSILGTANIAFFYIGLQTSTANAATLMYAGVPFLTAILAHRLIAERITIQKMMGIFIGIMGVIFIAMLPAIERGEIVSGGFPGNLFFLAAVIVWSLYIIGSRRAIATKGYSPLVVSSVSIFTTCAIFFGISLFTFRASYVPLLMQPSLLFFILHLGLGVTVGTYLLFQWAVKYSSATTTSLNHYLQPVFALLFNMIFLREAITAPLIVGIVLVFTGVMVTSGSHVLHEMRSWTRK